MADIEAPQYSNNMKLIGHSDQGGRPDAVQIMVEQGFAYVGHLFANGVSVIDVRDPRNPRSRSSSFRPRQTPGTFMCRRMTGFCSWSTPRTCGRNPILPTNATIIAPRPATSTRTPRSVEKQAWSAGMAVYDISNSRQAQANRLHADQGRRPPPDLVRRRPLGLCVGLHRGLQRLHHDHDRPRRSRQSEGGRAVLAAGNESRRGRDAVTGRRRPGDTDAIIRSFQATSLIAAGGTRASRSSTSRIAPRPS